MPGKAIFETSKGFTGPQIKSFQRKTTTSVILSVCNRSPSNRQLTRVQPMPFGELAVRGSVEGGYVRIDVSDTGIRSYQRFLYLIECSGDGGYRQGDGKGRSLALSAAHTNTSPVFGYNTL